MVAMAMMRIDSMTEEEFIEALERIFCPHKFDKEKAGDKDAQENDVRE
jgi:hypothetical protein